MLMKLTTVFMAAALVTVICLSGAAALGLFDADEHTIQHLVYTDDYPILLANELATILGDYSVGERVERHVDGEVCSCGYHQDTIDFYEWQITYTDACGQEMVCVLNNRQSLYYQQLQWLEDQIETHFFTNYVTPCFHDIMQESGSYCFCFIGRICFSYTGGNEEEYSHVETCTAYRDSIERLEELIPLASSSYPELFDMFPISLSVNIRLADRMMPEDEWNQNYAAAVAKLGEMALSMADDIGSNLNLDASVYSDVQTFNPGSRKTTIHYLRGEYTEITGFDFGHAVFLSYVGKFW